MWSQIQLKFAKIINQGLTNQQLAKALTVGFLGGLFPVIGLTTALCTMVAIRCKLNIIAVCFANFAVFPIQIALITVFLSLGQKILGADLDWELINQIDLQSFRSVGDGISLLWMALIKAIAIWLATCMVFYIPLFAGFLKLLLIYRKRYSSLPNNSTAF